MRVLVTGGTGFVGAHSIAALIAAGHEVRMLVRTPAKIGPALEPLGLPAQPFVVGDATDAGAVAQAMEGCDAVLHAASIFTVDPRLRAAINATNERCTEVVLGTAVQCGLDPIVYVSSYGALLSKPGAQLSPASPVAGAGAHFYAASKAAAEVVARRLQDEGHPVVITYPGFIQGPHQPDHDGESTYALRSWVRQRRHIITTGSMPIVDVRDVAAVHASVMEPGKGPRRYLVSGHRVTLTDIAETIAEVTGRPVKRTNMPAGAAIRAGRLADRAQRVFPIRLPVSEGAVWTVLQDPQCDDTATIDDLGITFRPYRETVTDAIRWLHATGQVTDAHAGRVAAVL